VVALVVALAAAPAKAREPRVNAVGEAATSVAAGSPACRDVMTRELRTGEITALEQCGADRQAAQRRQIKATGGRPVFGVVERSRAALTRVMLVVSAARGCSLWPLRLPGRPVLGLYEVKAAECFVRRYTGAVEIVGVLPDGGRVPGVFVARADDEGRLEFDLIDVDASLRRRGQPGLDAFVRLELGGDGWAGSVDLLSMRALLADQHAGWVQRGRGVPALMVVRHPKHPSADKIRGLALDAALKRQEADYQAVQRGELSPRRFRERHPWSPYRQLVAEVKP
jgi:hypothetical protein